MKSVEEILDYMYKTDRNLYENFIKAPAASSHHSNYEGGLLDHSKNVAFNLLEWKNKHRDCELTEEDCYIVGVLHDLCKTYLYKWNSDKNKYEADKSLYAHHAKLSIEMIQNRLVIKLSTLQRILILLHMSSWSNEEDFEALTEEDLKWLYDKKHIQLVQAMNWADMKATYEESKKENQNV